jgi:altronate hydrolase
MYPIIRLHPDDNVVIARTALMANTPIVDGIATSVRIPAGHKVSVRPIAQGEPVRRDSQIIGFTTADIAPGQHVHVLFHTPVEECWWQS